MPNQNMQWNELNNEGNPTKSRTINRLLLAVKRKEAARLGRESQERRPLEHEEWIKILELMEAHPDPEARCFLGGYFRYQFSMIARLDDTAKFRKYDLKPFLQYPLYGVISKLCLSKKM